MPQATIEIDDYQVLSALTRLTRNIDHLEPALDKIGAAVEASIMLNFREQHDPDGDVWEPLSDATLSQRRKPNRKGGKPTHSDAQILRDTSLLNRSISHQVGDFAVEIGSDKKYANMMQFGGTKAEFPWLWGDIPARPFVGVSEADRAEILDIIGQFLERSVAF